MTERDHRVDLLQGTLDLLILRTLQWGSLHGHAIAQSIRARSGDAFLVETGSLYPALHRLESRRWLSSEWRITENNQRAKVYSLTAAGRHQFIAEHSKWRALVAAMELVLRAVEE